MGLIDRARQDEVDQGLAALEDRTRADASLRQRKAQVAQVVTDKLLSFADTLGEDLIVITPGTYYQLGDVILEVQLNAHLSIQKMDLSRPVHVAMDCIVFLVAYDPTRVSQATRRIGSLQHLTYAALRDVLNQLPADLEPSAEVVRDLALSNA